MRCMTATAWPVTSPGKAKKCTGGLQTPLEHPALLGPCGLPDPTPTNSSLIPENLLVSSCLHLICRRLAQTLYLLVCRGRWRESAPSNPCRQQLTQDPCLCSEQPRDTAVLPGWVWEDPVCSQNVGPERPWEAGRGGGFHASVTQQAQKDLKMHLSYSLLHVPEYDIPLGRIAAHFSSLNSLAVWLTAH